MSEALLSGKKILVTAPTVYGKNLANLIRLKEGIAIEFPSIKTYIPSDLSFLQTFFQNINQYAGIVLPSRTAIEAFFKAYQNSDLKIDWQQMDFYALGNDQNYLETAFHIKVAAKPTETGPNGIIDYLKNHVPHTTKPFIIIAPKVIGIKEPNIIPDFLKNLSKAGFNGIKVEAYITETQNLSKQPYLMSAIKNKQLDIIAFTSSAEIAVLLKYFTTTELNQFKIACFGPYTGQNAIKMGLKPWYIGKKFGSFKDFVTGISQALQI